MAASRAPHPRATWRARLAPGLAPAVALLAWQLAAQTGWWPGDLLPGPLTVVKAAVALAVTGELWPQVRISLGRALVAVLLGGGLGLALGVVNGLSRTAGTVLDAALRMVRNLIALAFIPLILLGAGAQEAARVGLLSVGVFFPLYLGAFHGIRAVDPALVEMARAYGLARWPLLRDVILPGALPSIVTGLRAALALTWALLIVIETLAAQSGIGYLALRARAVASVDLVLLGILLYAVLGWVTDALVTALGCRLLRRNPAPRTANAF